jgi:hypothetical protein
MRCVLLFCVRGSGSALRTHAFAKVPCSVGRYAWQVSFTDGTDFVSWPGAVEPARDFSESRGCAARHAGRLGPGANHFSDLIRTWICITPCKPLKGRGRPTRRAFRRSARGPACCCRPVSASTSAGSSFAAVRDRCRSTRRPIARSRSCSSRFPSSRTRAPPCPGSVSGPAHAASLSPRRPIACLSWCSTPVIETPASRVLFILPMVFPIQGSWEDQAEKHL